MNEMPRVFTYRIKYALLTFYGCNIYTVLGLGVFRPANENESALFIMHCIFLLA